MVETQTSRKISGGSPWLTALLVFFVAVLLVNGFVFYAALTSESGYIEDSSYEKGLNFQTTIEKLAVPARLGWKTSLAVSGGEPSGARRVELFLQSSEGAALTGGIVKARLIRPADAKLDFVTQLGEEDAGTYASSVEFPAYGLWLFEIKIEHAGRQALLRERRFVE